MLSKALKDAIQLVFPVWFSRWFLWLTIFGLVEVFNQMLVSVLDGFEASQVGYILTSLTGSALDFGLALMVPHLVISIRKNESGNLSAHLKRVLNQASIESLRSTARVCWYSYLLFIPGFIKVLRLQFVAYIVQFDQVYDAGKVDALEASEKLSRGHLLQIFFIFVFCSLLTMLESIKSYFQWDSPFFALAFVLTLPIRLYTQIVWFSIFETLQNKRSNP